MKLLEAIAWIEKLMGYDQPIPFQGGGTYDSAIAAGVFPPCTPSRSIPPITAEHRPRCATEEFPPEATYIFAKPWREPCPFSLHLEFTEKDLFDVTLEFERLAEKQRQQEQAEKNLVEVRRVIASGYVADGTDSLGNPLWRRVTDG